ncbi:hypothetical protein I302_101106 [Kwoniella bestiolae CBS 10118]|uniref:Protein CPL1-like domain-containing protein n=1 Tax=Kwoniella bestiolae CBS 10118 TaxID=1296100 RepID=A0A1B9G718_9TREE|nr:hypothetical protein I302_04481 [Kwoniella bestiolae CBS 10118]OCF26791.1 hypothetical protein I302_04481 [Kwoniella bestiolae CBS 10118]
MLRIILPTLLAAISTLKFTAAGPGNNPIFLGCINDYTPGTFVATYDETSVDGCNAYCYTAQDGPYTYAGFVPEYNPGGIPGRKRQTVSLCACSNDSPAAQDYGNANTEDGSASCYSNQAAVYATDSSYNFQSCVLQNSLYDPEIGPPEDAFIPGLVDTPEECLFACRPYELASFQPDPMANQYNCLCGSKNEFNTESTSTCQPNAIFLYTHTANTVVSSQFAKRQMKERLIRLQNERNALCPKPLTACKVNGVADSFECIDTLSELESCGGCANGNFNANETSFGVDCTQLIGVAPGAVTCSQGKCQSFKCLPDFTLAANGTCIAA